MRLNVMMRGCARLARPAVLALAAMVAACGGGSSAVDEFKPQRILSFGDEYSVLESDGRKYSINHVDDETGQLACDESPLWIQVVAEHYGMAYEQCNADGLPETLATTYAEVGARADDLVAQVDSYTATGGTFNGALVTLLVGMHDVLELYPLYETQGEAALLSEMRVRGERYAATINNIINSGGKVLLVSTPDVGVTPFAIAERTTHTDVDRAALMSRMIDAFNFAVNVNIINDGRYIGLVLGDDFVRGAVRFPGTYGLEDTVTPACDVELPNCTSDTLVLDAEETSYMWADNLRPGPTIQLRIGLLAESRAENNPF